MYRYVQSMPTAPKEKIEEKPTDTVKPNITLTTEKIEIFKGEDIAYEKYIKEAMDDKDGDLSEKVNFNKIDANEVGEYEVHYRVKDKAGNESSATLKVVVKEKGHDFYLSVEEIEYCGLKEIYQDEKENDLEMMEEMDEIDK